MKRIALALLLLAAPLAAQTPTPTVTPTPTFTPTRTPTPTVTPTRTVIPPSRYSLATQVRPGFGTFTTEQTVNKLGDLYYAYDYRTFARLAGNTTTTQKFLCQTGTGTVSAAPGWCTVASAGKWATARLLAGNSVDGSANVAFSNKFIVQGTSDSGLSGAQFLGSLGTGILKNTTTTGVLSIAVGSDFPLFAGTTPGMVPDATAAGGGTFLDKSGNWTVPAGSVTSPLTTKGDVWGYSTGDTRVPVGPVGQMLTGDPTNSNGVSYKAPGAFTGTAAFSWSFQARTSGTVYQNTASYPMLVIASGVSSGTGKIEILSDASNPPTTSRGLTSNQSGFGINTLAWVLPSHYYKITATTSSLNSAAEYVFTRGSITDSGDLSGSRALGTVYQNTSGKTRFVAVEVGTSGSATGVTDAANPPTTNVMIAGISSGVGVALMFPVMNNHYYKVVQGGSASIVKWYEYDLDGLTVTQSASLSTRFIQVAAAATRSMVNVSGKSMLMFYSGHNNATNSVIAYAEPTTGFTAVPLPRALVVSIFSSATTVVRPAYLALNPMEAYSLIMDAGTATNDTWFEYTLE